MFIKLWNSSALKKIENNGTEFTHILAYSSLLESQTISVSATIVASSCTIGVGTGHSVGLSLGIRAEKEIGTVRVRVGF